MPFVPLYGLTLVGTNLGTEWQLVDFGLDFGKYRCKLWCDEAKVQTQCHPDGVMSTVRMSQREGN